MITSTAESVWRSIRMPEEVLCCGAWGISHGRGIFPTAESARSAKIRAKTPANRAIGVRHGCCPYGGSNQHAIFTFEHELDLRSESTCDTCVSSFVLRRSRLSPCLAPRAIASAEAPLALDSARVTIAGTSNVHEYTASTTEVRVTRVQLGAAVAGADFWENALKPGAVEAFEIAIPAATLSSPKDGLDKNMHKALKVDRSTPTSLSACVRFEPKPNAPARSRAIGMLQIAGVEREVALDITTKRKDADAYRVRAASIC